MFTNFGKRNGYRSIAVNTGCWENIQPFGETDDVHFTRDENLKLLKHIFEKRNIRYCLLFGTLLGQYRENDFIPGDGDDDLYVDQKHINDFNDDMLKELENSGFLWLRSYKNRMITIGRNGRYIDLCFLGNHRKLSYLDYYDFNGSHFYHQKYFEEEFKFGLLNGELYPILNNTRGFLRATYGADFMTPKNTGFNNKIVHWML